MGYKVLAFEYLVCCLLRWKAEILKFDLEEVSISKTQALKLLFLASAIPGKEGDDLLSVFNHFYAMQFGPVESDIYNAIMDKGFVVLQVNDSLLSVCNLDERTFIDLDNSGVKSRIDIAVHQLQLRNNSLVLFQASRLVDITHKWWCWKDAYEKARLLDKGSFPMNETSIRESNKVFE